MKAFLAVFALLGLLIPLPTQAAITITVTSTADSGPGSLRDAIATASPGDNINFSVTGTIALTTGTLTIAKSVTISGPGASNLAISGNNAFQVFKVNSGAIVTISGLTIENGSASGGGAGIFNSGTLTVTDSTVSANSTDIDGGGIFNSGTLTVTNTTVSGNSVSCCFGGGIFNEGTLAVTNSSVSGNSSKLFYGGGIFNQGTFTLTNSTVSGNSVKLRYGGGIFNLGTLTVTNGTVAGNSVPSGGGGIGNFLGTLALKNTIVANSVSGGNCYNDQGTFGSQGHNLSDDDSCTSLFTNTGDKNSTPAGLDPGGLKNNGGPTPTIALLPASAGVDAIPTNPTNYCTLADGTTPIDTDQRGVSRLGGPACDSGAFELVQTITVPIDIKPGENPAPINPKSRGTIPIAILSSAAFDAVTQVDQASLTFGRTGSEKSLAFCSGPQDVNGDGLWDLVCHFDTPMTGFQAGNTVGVLHGKTVDGNAIMGTDSVLIVH